MSLCNKSVNEDKHNNNDHILFQFKSRGCCALKYEIDIVAVKEHGLILEWNADLILNC